MPKVLLKTTSNASTIIKVSACHDMKCMHLTASTSLKLSAPSTSLACAGVPDIVAWCLPVIAS